MPKVSVCIPAYNQPALFKRCLESVLKQNFKDYEIIVSDDSTDNTIGDLVKSLSVSFIRYFKNNRPLGSPGNWNNAIRQASGEYIKILHHDDYFHETDSLGKFVDALEKNEASFAFCQSRIYYKSDNSYFIHKQNEGQLKRLADETEFIYFRNIIGAPSAVIYRRNEELFFDEDFKWLVDVEFYIRYLKKHPRFKCIPEPLVTVVAGEEGQISSEITRDKNRVIRENLILFSRIYNQNLNRKKSLLFFQELFESYGIHNLVELQRDFRIPPPIANFMNEVFDDMQKLRLLKKIKKRLLTSRYNKRIFKIERF